MKVSTEPAPISSSLRTGGNLAAEIARVRERFERLLEAGITIASEVSVEDVLRQVVESARAVVGARYAALGVIGEDGRTLVRFETAGLSPAERERIGQLPLGLGLLGVIIREARPLRIPRISDDPRRHGFPAHHPRMESFLGVPVLGRERVIGNLYLTDKVGAEEFTPEDEQIAVLLAAQAAAAIEQAQLYQTQAELLERLQGMQRQRDHFFAMMNHELRNALTGVYGWAEQLARAKSDGVKERAGREVLESAERTIVLLNNLLDLSRLDAGKMQVTFRDCDLAETLDGAISQVRPAADAKSIPIRVELVSTPATIKTDPVKLGQVVVNLLSNAVRHSPAGEAIVVRAEGAMDQVLINVIDRGPGIAQQDQRRIFEPYVRVDPETGLGSGLGLPVSRRIAELIGGRLSVHSDLGGGATFTLALPTGA